jgi:hypothetical protein
LDGWSRRSSESCVFLWLNNGGWTCERVSNPSLRKKGVFIPLTKSGCCRILGQNFWPLDRIVRPNFRGLYREHGP